MPIIGALSEGLPGTIENPIACFSGQALTQDKHAVHSDEKIASFCLIRISPRQFCSHLPHFVQCFGSLFILPKLKKLIMPKIAP